VNTAGTVTMHVQFTLSKEWCVKTATKYLTARELYDSHRDVKGLIDSWVDTRYCPVPLVDALLEAGALPGAVKCVRWACDRGHRRVFLNSHDRRDVFGNVYPALYSGAWAVVDPLKGWYWLRKEKIERLTDWPDFRSHVIYGSKKFPYCDFLTRRHDTALEAILWLLDSY
jgi:hypothetical protein